MRVDEIALRRPPPNRVKISLTPLIDVVFILLVFFMLASSFLDWRTIRLSAASESTAGGGVEGALLVEVGPTSVRLAGATMTLDELQDSIGGRLAKTPSQRILLKPARGVDMQRLVSVIDRLEAEGATDVALLPAIEP